MNKAQYFLKKHASTILTITGAAGVVVTSVLAVKATPKAMMLIEKAKEEKKEDLTVLETVKVAWKPYIPAVISGASTIACIFSANYLSIKSQASIMSAYALLDNAYKEYRSNVDELYGEKADVTVKREMIKSRLQDIKVEEGKELFFDFQSMQVYQSTLDEVIRVGEEFKKNFKNRGYAFLNEYYYMLGIPLVQYGYQLGWDDLIEDCNPYNCFDLDFEYEEIKITDGPKCWVVTMTLPPSFDYVL